MGNIHILIIGLVLVFLHNFSNAQFSGGLDTYNRLESRLNALNSSLTQQQKQIDVIIADIVVQELAHENNLKTLKDQLKSTQEKLTSVEKGCKEATDLAASNAAQLLSTDIQLLELASRMDKLDATNQLWKSNFQVVNRTFSELKKKLVIGVPFLNGVKV